jgi:ATP-dependent exoDNAse (exonuclease V) beta subunit
MKEFRHIMFFEDRHVYFNKQTGEEYTSVTTHISKYVPKFDTDFWAVYKHLQRQGLKPQNRSGTLYCEPYGKVTIEEHLADAADIIQSWSDISVQAKEKGTFIHLFLENLFKNKVITIPDKYKDCVAGAWAFYNQCDLYPVFEELIVADDEWKIAGQVDRPFLISAKDKLLSVADYKTDKEIKLENPYESLKKFGMPNTNFSKYTLQLNMYRAIIERNTPWKIRDLKIVHITDSDFKVYEIPKMKDSDLF